MTFTLTEMGLILLVMTIGVTLTNLAWNANQTKTMHSENTQLKTYVQILLKERKDKSEGPPAASVPPFLNFDIGGDMTVGGDVAGRDKRG